MQIQWASLVYIINMWWTDKIQRYTLNLLLHYSNAIQICPHTKILAIQVSVLIQLSLSLVLLVVRRSWCNKATRNPSNKGECFQKFNHLKEIIFCKFYTAKRHVRKPLFFWEEDMSKSLRNPYFKILWYMMTSSTTSSSNSLSHKTLFVILIFMNMILFIKIISLLIKDFITLSLSFMFTSYHLRRLQSLLSHTLTIETKALEWGLTNTSLYFPEYKYRWICNSI